MANSLGIFCRKLRIERGEVLYDMAKKLEVSSSFLSKVENGKKKPPAEWEKKIIDYYNLSGEKKREFTDCFFDALNNDYIDISKYNEKDKKLMLSFAREFDELDKALIESILKLRKEKKD